MCSQRGNGASVCLGGDCQCPPRFNGTNCGTCANYCINGVANNTNDCNCVCNGAWTTNTTVPYSPCTICNVNLGNTLICGDKGTVNATTCSTCQCRNFWSGPVASNGQFTNCNTCPLTNRTCVNGYVSSNCTCICNDPWINDPVTGLCTGCDATKTSQFFCNGRGDVNATICSGDCTCRDGWIGTCFSFFHRKYSQH
jgi:hypothetical protein